MFSALVSPAEKNRRERSDDRKYVCGSQASFVTAYYIYIPRFYLGYLRGRSFPLKKPCFPPPPLPSRRDEVSAQSVTFHKIVSENVPDCISVSHLRRLEVVGKREKGRTRGRHACLLLARPFFLVSTTIQALDLLQVDLLVNGASLFWPAKRPIIWNPTKDFFESLSKRLLRRLTSQRIFISKKFPGGHAPGPP